LHKQQKMQSTIALRRGSILRILLPLVLLIAGFGHAQAQTSEIYVSGGKAIDGYDPVAYFALARPVKGVDSLSYQWKGAIWLFSSRQNLKAFMTSPEKYAPQYGGYCAYGTAQGHKASTEADAWTIVNNKLYLNYNGKVKSEWVKDEPGNIQKADKQWPAIKNKD
jgi:YHS domain-containing protein